MDTDNDSDMDIIKSNKLTPFGNDNELMKQMIKNESINDSDINNDDIYKKDDSDWMCAVCAFVNECDDDECLMCHTKKIKSIKISSKLKENIKQQNKQNKLDKKQRWTCPSCTFENKLKYTACKMCGTINMKIAGLKYAGKINKTHKNGKKIKNGNSNDNSNDNSSADIEAKVDNEAPIKPVLIGYNSLDLMVLNNEEMVHIIAAKQGYVYKKGEQIYSGWKRRFIAIYSNKIMEYFTDQKKKEKKGSINLNRVSVKNVVTCVKNQAKQAKYGFQIKTLERIWYFSVETTSIRDSWIATIRNIITGSWQEQYYELQKIKKIQQYNHNKNKKKVKSKQTSNSINLLQQSVTSLNGNNDYV